MWEGMSDERLRSVTGRIRAADPSLDVSQRICLVAREFFDAKSVSLSLVVGHGYRPIAATDDTGSLLDEEQFAAGDGPTFWAQNSPTPVIVEDSHGESETARWPIFAKLAERSGIRGTFAFPLRVGEAFLGVLTAYRAHAGAPSAEQYAYGLVLASLATAELVRREAGIEPGKDGFEPRLYNQSVLQIAAGMVAESLGIQIFAALARIRARAFADDQPVSHTAQLIVARKLVLEK